METVAGEYVGEVTAAADDVGYFEFSVGYSD